LTSANVYTKDASAVLPVLDIQPPFYVVSRIDSSNGVGGIYSSQYSYAGLKSDPTGRGLLGFRQMQVTDLQTQIADVTNYRQDFPYIGLVASTSRRYLATGQVLGQSTNTYQFLNGNSAPVINRLLAPYRVFR
jgi:hypothetical protein